MIESLEFIKRRRLLLEWMQPESVAVLFSAKTAQRNSDVNHPFRQNSSFYYLTGHIEPDSALILLKTNELEQSIFFTLPNDPIIEQWEGARVGVQGALSDYGADTAFPIQQLSEKILKYLANKQVIYGMWGECIEQDNQILTALQLVQKKAREGLVAPSQLVSLRPVLSSMRRIKSSEEIDCMRIAAQVSAQAHLQLMKTCRPGQYEYELEAEFLSSIMKNGCREQAYPAIIGAGKHACVLHYTKNNAKIQDGDLVLVDAGGEYQHYAADITRTFPANGQFSAEQKAIYELVLSAQLAALDQVQPGVSWSAQQQVIVEILTAGLLELGLLKGSLAQCLADEAYKTFYMHKNGHWLGLDVHDVGSYKNNGDWDKLEPGMVLTVEPGLYIGENPNVDKKWWNIGVRIEDDVVVTDSGHEVLSSMVPKQVDEIEAVMRDSKK